MQFNFICHPYHRGGVTSWMKNAFLETQFNRSKSIFLTVSPVKPFISSGNRPDMVSFLDQSSNVYVKNVGVEFELGTLEYRASVYRRLIMEHAAVGDVLIPSDDQACWMACCQSASKFKVIGVFHSDDAPYYNLYDQYKNYLSGAVSVSNRIKSRLVDSKEEIPHRVIPCGIPLKEFEVGEGKSNTISWIGRIEEDSKRVSDILKIANHLNQEVNDWEIHVYGDGYPLEGLKAETVQNKLFSILKFHGWTSADEIHSRLSSSKILLQTSNFEGMSVAVMEALASGCLVVSSAVSGVEDLIEDPDAQGIVFLYPVGDIILAKKQLLRAMDSFNNKLSKNAIALAYKYYSISTCMTNYQEFCEPLKLDKSDYPTKPAWAQIISWLFAYLRLIKFKIMN